MEFGEWLQIIRLEKNLDTRDLATKVGIDPSTVSRTENKITQTSIYTAFKICEGLKVPLLELASSLANRDFSTLRESRRHSHRNEALSLHEISDFITYFLNDNSRATEELVKNLNTLSHSMFESEIFEKGLIHNNIYDLPVTNTDIDRILFKNQLFQPLEINYPISINPTIIADIYWETGALMVTDVETYINKRRLKAKKSLPIGSLRTSNRIGSGSVLERTSLSSVLDFDIETEQNGMILGMYWEACKFYDTFRYFRGTRYDLYPFFSRLPKRVGSSEVGYGDLINRLAIVYLTINRWRQYMRTKS